MNTNERKTAFNKAVNEVNARVMYGIRQQEVPKGTHYELMWSSSSHCWFVTREVNIDIINLDANMIIVRADNYKEASLIAKELPELPLYSCSFEAKKNRYNKSAHLRAVVMAVV